jgi:hypothetical protein
MIDCCRSRTADEGGTPEAKVPAAPAPAARDHGRRLFHVDPLVLVGGAPRDKAAL